MQRSGLAEVGAAPAPDAEELRRRESRYALLRGLQHPLWIFDFDLRRVHWANAAALKVWRAVTVDELCARDLGRDMSESIARRLSQYRSDFLSHGSVFHERWTLYPNDQPVSLDVSFSGFPLDDGRMAMLCEGHAQVSDAPEALRSVEALLHTTLMISLFDLEGAPMYRNPAARAAVRSPQETLQLYLCDSDTHAALMQRTLRDGLATVTAQVHTVRGIRWHELSARRCRDAATGADALLVSEADVTQLKESEAQASYLAEHDPLTGLPNRNQVRQHFARAMRDLELVSGQAALVMIDLDHFKDVNDTLGHAVGDELLVEVARRLRAAVRRGDLVARFGGDEFLILVSSSDAAAEVQRIDDRIRRTVCQPVSLGGSLISVTATLGVAMFPRDGRDFESLLRSADLAMYSAKEGGRNALAFYEADMGLALRARTELEAALTHALRDGQFEVHYQPRVAVADDHVVGAEALVRWRHPTRGLLPPSEFIPLCESTGLIHELGRQVFGMVARQVAGWALQGLELMVSVNVSAVEFRDPAFASRLAGVLRGTGCDPGRLQVEITESMLLGDDERVQTTLQALHGLGLSIALDDFGTGYSNLAYLQRFPIEVLKIDRSFLKGLSSDRPLAELIVQLCRLMHLLAVAEGVETEEQLRWIRTRGVREYQGYLFARPMSGDAFEALALGQRAALQAAFSEGDSDRLSRVPP